MDNSNYAATDPAIAGAIEQSISGWGDESALDKVDYAERKRGISICWTKRSRMTEHNLADIEPGGKNMNAPAMDLCGTADILDGLLKDFAASIAAQRYLVMPASRAAVLRRDRGRWNIVATDAALQMDWDSVRVQYCAEDGRSCVSTAIACHHSSELYGDFINNSRASLFIAIIHGISDENGRCGNRHNFSGKLPYGTLQYSAALQLAGVPGYDLAWVKHGKGGR